MRLTNDNKNTEKSHVCICIYRLMIFAQLVNFLMKNNLLLATILSRYTVYTDIVLHLFNLVQK